METSPILKLLGYAVYATMAGLALFGLFCFVLLWRRIGQKRFSSVGQAEAFLEDARDCLQKKDFEGVAEMCDTPPYWSKAVPQLMMVGIDNRSLSPPRLRRVLGERFEREILADLEYRTSWINTVVKSAPMLGLLGTVMGMIAAFGKIAGEGSGAGVDPKTLANDIAFALNTTAIGLTIAIPLVLLGNVIAVRVGKMQDQVQEYLGEFLEDLGEATGQSASAGRERGSGA